MELKKRDIGKSEVGFHVFEAHNSPNVKFEGIIPKKPALAEKFY